MASTTSSTASRSRLLLLLGTLAVVAVIYLCLPRAWFEIPDDKPPGAQVSNTVQQTSNTAPPAPDAQPSPPDMATLRAEAQKTPLDFGARSRYGMALAAAGQHADAEKEFLAAVRLAPESPGVHHNLGIFYYNLNQPQRADASFRRELEIAPANARAHHFRGLVLQAQRKDKAAAQQFRLAIALEPDFPDTYLSLAMSLSRDAPEEEVRKLIEEYIHRTGNKGLAYYVLSGAYRTRRDFATAVRYAELAHQAEPENYAYLHNLGQVYSYAKRYADADATLRRALRQAKDPTTVLIELGMNSQNTGKYSEAVAFFQQALEASPSTGNIHLYLARAYQRLGDKAAARREEIAFRKWNRETLEADARAKLRQAQQQSKTMHSSQKP